MIILFSTKKLQKELCNSKMLQKKYGDLARRIKERLSDIDSAENLAELSMLPQLRCHELKGDYAGKFGIVLRSNWRLICEPGEKPVPKKEDEGVDREKVTSLRILRVKEDYHGQ